MIINLLPTEEKILLRRRYFSHVLFVAAGLFAALVIFSLVSLLPSYIQLKYAIVEPAHRAGQNKKSAYATSTLSSLSETIKNINTKISIVNSASTDLGLTKQSILIVRIVDALKRATGTARAKCTISSMHFTAQAGDEKAKTLPSYAVSISGVAENREVLLRLTKELGRTEGVVSVDNPISNYVPGKNLSFNISIAAK